jgi:hypothetical protein
MDVASPAPDAIGCELHFSDADGIMRAEVTSAGVILR